MEKKQIDWENLGFGYVQTEQRYVSNYKDGKWDDGCLTEDANITYQRMRRSSAVCTDCI